MKKLGIALLLLAACRASKDAGEAANPATADTNVASGEPVWIGIYYCGEGLVLGSMSPAPPLMPAPDFRETSVTISESDIFALYAGLLREGLREEVDRGGEIATTGIPPATYTIVVSCGPQRTEARFYHTPGYEIPRKYLAEFERLKVVAGAPLWCAIAENHAALMERR